MGFRRVSKVLEDVMRAAERALISVEVSGRNDTPRSWEEMGWEGFMASPCSHITNCPCANVFCEIEGGRGGVNVNREV